MLNGISWEDFITGLGLLAIGYYITMMVLYYQADIKNSLKWNSKKSFQSTMETEQGAMQQILSIEELEEVVSDIRESILEKAGNNVSKAELLQQLKARLIGYEGLHQPAYRVAIRNYLIKETNEICGVVLSEVDLECMWEVLPR